MCSFISEWPNLVPAGIGNGNSAIDTNILLSGYVMMATDELSGSDQDDGWLMAEDADIGVHEDKLVVKKDRLVIPKKGPNGKPTKKTKVQAGSSNHMTSTPRWPSSTKSKNIMERFSEVAKIEEETAQKQLELKKFQVKSTNDIAVANI